MWHVVSIESHNGATRSVGLVANEFLLQELCIGIFRVHVGAALLFCTRTKLRSWRNHVLPLRLNLVLNNRRLTSLSRLLWYIDVRGLYLDPLPILQLTLARLH